MDKHEWLKVVALVSFILSMMLIYGDIVGIGVLFLLIFIASVIVLRLGFLKGK